MEPISIPGTLGVRSKETREPWGNPQGKKMQSSAETVMDETLGDGNILSGNHKTVLNPYEFC